MVWHALIEIEEAAKKTRELILPFDWKLWAKIAVMAFFVGGASFPGFFTGGDISSEPGQSFDPGTEMSGDVNFQSVGDLGVGAFIIAVAAAVIGLVLVFGVLKAVFEFVYYQSLIDDDIRIRENFVEHFTNGLRLFIFEIASLLAFMTLFAVILLPIAISPLFLISAVILGIPMILLMIVFYQFTTDFIPLYMIEEGLGVIASWRKLYQAIIDEWRQLGLYIIVKIALGVMAQIAIGTGALLIGLLLIIPVGLPVFLLYLISPLLAVLAGLLGVVIWALAILYLLNGPATTFFRYYTLLVYNDLTQVENAEN